jgi:DNA topoisomerase IB
MNPSYTKGSTVYYCKAMAAHATQYQSIYTKQTKQSNKTTKFVKIGSTIKNLQTVIKKWRVGLKKQRQESVLVELLYQTQGRIGSLGNETKNEQTYGLSTLKRKHLKYLKGGVRITYKGKKGVTQEHFITRDDNDEGLISLIKFFDTVKDYSPNDDIFEVSASTVNAYLKTLGAGITAHGFRTIKGSILMSTELDLIKEKYGARTNPAKLFELFDKAALKVGSVLGHVNTTVDGVKVTGQTALKYYINPDILRDFFDHYNLRPKTATLEKLLYG